MLAERQFTMQDQLNFAMLSGDRNPIHVDAVAARRTSAGRPVVHGVHNLLWCLNAVSEALGILPEISALRANFNSFVAVDEMIEIVLIKRDAAGLRAEVKAGNTSILVVALVFGSDEAVAAVAEDAGDVFDGDDPFEPGLEQMIDLAGRVRVAATGMNLGHVFPHAALLLGTSRVAGLGVLTRLVGMVCPGLHSIFNGLSLKTCPVSDEALPTIAYRVKAVDSRYRRLVQEVSGCGWTGTLTCSVRHPPFQQPSMELLKGLVAPDAFRGTTALVVGGSRGLGELTAKLIATGGGSAIITYVAGHAEAEALMRSIQASGGSASTLRYDVLEEPEPQLAMMETIPTQLYYFATPIIASRRNTVFSQTRFDQFIKYYVTGFTRLMDALLLSNSTRLDVFYPSTVFVQDRPEGLTEYAMAKAAGEALCTDLSKYRTIINILAPRLPRLSTDQTAGLDNLAKEKSVSIILDYIIALHQFYNDDACS